jgi:hypothetical protein
MTLNKIQLTALTRLFSPSVVREMAKNGQSSLFARFFNETGLSKKKSLSQITVGAALDAAFKALSKSGLRAEYVYRAALTHNILLGRHSLKTASLLTEFRAGSSKADLVILNGTATVYEIKSDRDSLARLTSQLINYRKVFAKIYVIAGNNHVNEVVKHTQDDIGVLSLVRWNRIHIVREAIETYDFVCPVTIFESLRMVEAQKILENMGEQIPDLPNTMMHLAMRDIFARLDRVEVHREMVRTLKQTRNLTALNEVVDKLPMSLQPAALALQVRRVDHQRLLQAVNTPLEEALNWA